MDRVCRPPGKGDGGEQVRPGKDTFPHLVDQQAQSFCILHPMRESDQFTPVQALAEGHEIQKDLFQRLGLPAMIGCGDQSPDLTGEAFAQMIAVQEQSANGDGGIEGLSGR